MFCGHGMERRKPAAHRHAHLVVQPSHAMPHVLAPLLHLPTGPLLRTAPCHAVLCCAAPG